MNLTKSQLTYLNKRDKDYTHKYACVEEILKPNVLKVDLKEDWKKVWG